MREMMSNADAAPAEGQDVLERVELPVEHAAVALASGRRLELSASAGEDRITVRNRDGAMVLRISLGETGATLELSGREIELRAPDKLTLAARDIALRAERDLELQVGRDVREIVAGARHTTVAGVDRLEAAAVELQASEQSVRVRAMEAIALDGEHIGLNDDPCPQPFAWSSIAPGEHTEEISCHVGTGAEAAGPRQAAP